MRTFVLCATALTLASCATPEQLQARVGNASNFQLCRAIMLAPQNVAQIAREEASRRSLDCEPYASGVLQSERANDAAANALAQRLLSPPQPAYQPPVSCRSYRIGNTVQTDCN